MSVGSVGTYSPYRDWRMLLRSGAVGVIATLVDLLLLVLLIDALGWTKGSANIPALSVGLAVQFLGNKYYAFEDRSTEQLARQGILFGASKRAPSS